MEGSCQGSTLASFNMCVGSVREQGEGEETFGRQHDWPESHRPSTNEACAVMGREARSLTGQPQRDVGGPDSGPERWCRRWMNEE